MSVDEVVEEVLEKQPTSKMDAAIAILVAVVATFMAVGNIKDGNIVQAMGQAQAQGVSKWSQYQSKSTKQNLAESATEQLTALRDFATTPEAKARLDARIQFQKSETARYEKEKGEVKKEAEGLQAEYDRLNTHDDQFDMSEACLSISIALFGITALTRKRWLFFFASGLAAVGLALGLSGFLGWTFHPDWLAKLLG